MRVGVLGHGFIDWGGGIDFLRTLVSSMVHADKSIELHILLPTAGPRLAARNALHSTYGGVLSLLGRKVVAPPRVANRHISELASSMEPGLKLHAIDSGQAAIARASRRLALDALLPAITPLPDGFPSPWVGYVFDFQHCYFPEHFADSERAQRDRQFAAMLSSARAVIVNSRSVAADIARFHANARARVFALPFSAAPQPAWLGPSTSPAPTYGVHKPYFIVCNQFWKHKDHATAFAAFALVAASHPDIDLVCTGATDDYRDPTHFSSLLRGLAVNGISSRVHILGMVPKADQIGLMKDAIALIQPTLFEGGPGGGAVYDAIALGLRCLVSDIDVNRELDEPEIEFFPAGNSAELAMSMRRLLGQPNTATSSATVLIERGSTRRSACGVALLAAIDYVRQ